MPPPTLPYKRPFYKLTLDPQEIEVSQQQRCLSAAGCMKRVLVVHRAHCPCLVHLRCNAVRGVHSMDGPTALHGVMRCCLSQHGQTCVLHTLSQLVVGPPSPAPATPLCAMNAVVCMHAGRFGSHYLEHQAEKKIITTCKRKPAHHQRA